MSACFIPLLNLVLCSTSPADNQYGVLKLTEPLVIKTSEKAQTLPQGKHFLTIEFEKNLLSPNAVILKIKDEAISLPMNSENFSKIKDGSTFEIQAKDLEQTFSFSGTHSTSTLPKTTRTENETCTYCGYCHHMNGSAQLVYGYHSACQGHQKVEYEITTTQIAKRIAIKQGDKEVGTIEVSPVSQENKRKIKEVTDCN